MPTEASKRWLFGPKTDLLFGCGAIYLVAFAVLAAAGPRLQQILPLELASLVLLVSGIPHYGATLLRVYERAEDRRRYAVFSVWATALIGAAFVAGTRSLIVGSVLVTLYFTWSPWHYAGQNYGIALMFLRRREVTVTPRAKRLLWWSFVLSYALTMLALHGQGDGTAYAPGGEFERSAYQLLPLGIPSSAVAVLLPSLLAVHVGCLLWAFMLLRREAPLRELLPTALIAGSQALWFTVPLAVRHFGVLQSVAPLAAEQATYAFLWIAVAHGIQYLWVTTYFERQRAPRALGGYWARILAAGAAVWVVPALLFAPGLLGDIPHDAGLGLLVAAVVNLHHFVLDGAIWKLRDGPIARVLLRGERDEGPAGGRTRWRPAPLVWTVGGVAALVLLIAPLERVLDLAPAALRDDPVEVAAAHRRLSWLGQESALVHVTTALMQQRHGDLTGAEQSADAALALHPDYATLANLAVYYQRAGRGDQALDAAERALAMQPQSSNLADKVAWLLLHYGHEPASDVPKAIELAQRSVAATDGTDARRLVTLAQAYAAAGRVGDAERTATQALAHAGDDRALAALLTSLLESYRQPRESR